MSLASFFRTISQGRDGMQPGGKSQPETPLNCTNLPRRNDGDGGPSSGPLEAGVSLGLSRAPET
jgi:hypothetical protein